MTKMLLSGKRRVQAEIQLEFKLFRAGKKLESSLPSRQAAVKFYLPWQVLVCSLSHLSKALAQSGKWKWKGTCQEGFLLVRDNGMILFFKPCCQFRLTDDITVIWVCESHPIVSPSLSPTSSCSSAVGVLRGIECNGRGSCIFLTCSGSNRTGGEL